MQRGNLHPALESLYWLIGRWKSVTAEGYYPTIKPFSYCEEIEFSSYGQPLLNYQSSSWHPEKLCPMHLESGFLRINPNSQQVAFMVAHNFGLTSLEEGEIEDKRLRLKSTGIQRMGFAKEPAVTEICRELKLNDNSQLVLTLSMATANTPLTKHLEAVYEKSNSI